MYLVIKKISSKSHALLTLCIAFEKGNRFCNALPPKGAIDFVMHCPQRGQSIL